MRLYMNASFRRPRYLEPHPETESPIDSNWLIVPP
jgi:hypothetical protein